MCSWLTVDNYLAYRGAILGFVGCFLALMLAYKEFREKKLGWVKWVELCGAVVLFAQSVSDILQVNADAKQHARDMAVQTERINAISKSNWPRVILFNEQSRKFRDSLKGKNTGQASIWYLPEDVEAQEFGISILGDLQMAGWTTPEFGPIPTNMIAPEMRGGPDGSLRMFALQERQTGTLWPLVIMSRDGTDRTSLAGVLSSAFGIAGFPASTSGDASLPSNKVVIV